MSRRWVKYSEASDKYRGNPLCGISVFVYRCLKRQDCDSTVAFSIKLPAANHTYRIVRAFNRWKTLKENEKRGAKCPRSSSLIEIINSRLCCWPGLETWLIVKKRLTFNPLTGLLKTNQSTFGYQSLGILRSKILNIVPLDVSFWNRESAFQIKILSRESEKSTTRSL